MTTPNIPIKRKCNWCGYEWWHKLGAEDQPCLRCTEQLPPLIRRFDVRTWWKRYTWRERGFMALIVLLGWGIVYGLLMAAIAVRGFGVYPD